MGPLVRIEDATLGAEAQVRLVVSGVSDPARLRSAWAASGAALQLVGERIHATTTVQALARAGGRALPSEEARALDRALRDAVSAWLGPPPSLAFASTALDLAARPLIAGIVNVTPDSFSESGLLYPDAHPQRAVEHAKRLLAEGADLLDVGGESTRPGAEPVDEAEELRRVVPVLDALQGAAALVSIDTTKARVARAALERGAVIVNDVSGAQHPDLLEVVSEAGAGYVLMHTRGTPQDMQQRTDYGDVVAEVYEFLAAGLERCAQAGIPEERVLVDPGIGFAKTPAQNLALLHALRQLRSLGRPVFVGTSRKSFIGAVLDGAGPSERLEGDLACVTLAVAAGAAVLRMHDVAPALRAARLARAITTGEQSWPRVLPSGEPPESVSKRSQNPPENLPESLPESPAESPPENAPRRGRVDGG